MTRRSFRLLIRLGLASIAFASIAAPAAAQRPDDAGGRPDRPAVYGYGGFGVLGHVRIESEVSMPSIAAMSTTGRLGVDFPIVPFFAVGAELRGTIVRGFPGYATYVGDLSGVARWRIPIRGSRWRLEVAAVTGPTAGMLWVREDETLMDDRVMARSGMIGGHAGGIASIATRIASKMELGVYVGHVHQVLFSPPPSEGPSAPPLHLDQFFVQTELRFDL